MLPGMSETDPTAASTTFDRAIGIDVGGTGVKAAVVDLRTGQLASPRIRLKTPQPSTPVAVIDAIGTIVDRLTEGGHVTPGMPAGAGLPGVVKQGRLLTAANIDKGWVDAEAARMISERIGHPCVLVNDADAAGLAEVTFGAAKDVPGTVLLLTIGTGIGSALFIDGHLLDSTEFGHVPFHGRDAETLISGAARERRRLGWRKWARLFSEYIAQLDRWFWPDLIILGGGVSKEYSRYSKWLKARAPIITAQYLNTSGIVGAGLAAAGVGHAAALLARDLDEMIPPPPAEEAARPDDLEADRADAAAEATEATDTTAADALATDAAEAATDAAEADVEPGTADSE
jgi:polyphosphate glucokinase